MTTSPTAGISWHFPRTFWAANIIELFERAAYFGMFIALTLYLTNVVGFSDINAAWVAGLFSGGLYLLPPFSGALADAIGFRRALLLAFSLLTVGYCMLGLLPYRAAVVGALVLIMIGGSGIKVAVTGAVTKTSNDQSRARAFSIFYGVVNIGAFCGKGLAYPLRLHLGLEAINLYAAAMTLLALVAVALFFKQEDTPAAQKTMGEVWSGFKAVILNSRLLVLILIATGFWVIQQQMYATMPKLVLRTVGTSASPEWLANVNPLVVVVSVMFVTQMMKKASALTSMIVGLALMPVSALCMALGGVLERSMGGGAAFAGSILAHPITLALILGTSIQGLGECFVSPRYLEFFSKQAPAGQEGLYLGFAHLHSFFAAVIGFGVSGYLLNAYCPDPRTLTPEQLIHAYDHAHYIWYYFAGIGVVDTIAMALYGRWSRR
jgi:dipeptide/tripeptide permease